MCRLLGFLLIVAAPPALAAVSRCQDDGGHLHFGQFGCPEGMVQVPREPAPTAPMSVVVTPPLSPEELSALSRLEESLERQRADRARARRQASRARAKRDRESAALCVEARRRLEALAADRRKGYSATEASRLEAEEARWRAARKSAC